MDGIIQKINSIIGLLRGDIRKIKDALLIAQTMYKNFIDSDKFDTLLDKIDDVLVNHKQIKIKENEIS